MSEVKFGADLLVDGQRVGGHIIIDDNKLTWKPVLSKLTNKLTGISTFEIPIENVEGYKKSGSKLVLGITGYSEYPCFYTLKSQDIVDTISSMNPAFRMYASNEIEGNRNWNEILIWIVIIAGILIYHFVFKS